MESPRKASHKAVADPGEGPWGPALPFPPNSRFFLDQTETPKGKTKFLKPGSPLPQGLDHHPPSPHQPYESATVKFFCLHSRKVGNILVYNFQIWTS